MQNIATNRSNANDIAFFIICIRIKVIKKVVLPPGIEPGSKV